MSKISCDPAVPRLPSGDTLPVPASVQALTTPSDLTPVDALEDSERLLQASLAVTVPNLSPKLRAERLRHMAETSRAFGRTFDSRGKEKKSRKRLAALESAIDSYADVLEQNGDVEDARGKAEKAAEKAVAHYGKKFKGHTHLKYVAARAACGALQDLRAKQFKDQADAHSSAIYTTADGLAMALEFAQQHADPQHEAWSWQTAGVLGMLAHQLENTAFNEATQTTFLRVCEWLAVPRPRMFLVVGRQSHLRLSNAFAQLEARYPDSVLADAIVDLRNAQRESLASAIKNAPPIAVDSAKPVIMTRARR